MGSERYKIGISIVVVVAAFSLMLILYIVSSSPSSSNVSYPESGPVTIRLEANKSSYALGEVVKIRIYLINHKNETVKIQGGFPSAKFEVFNSKGDCIDGHGANYNYPSDYWIIVQPQSETLLEVPPLGWDQQRVVSVQGSHVTLKQADPGTYTIRVTLEGPIGSFSSETIIEIKGDLPMKRMINLLVIVSLIIAIIGIFLLVKQ